MIEGMIYDLQIFIYFEEKKTRKVTIFILSKPAQNHKKKLNLLH